MWWTNTTIEFRFFSTMRNLKKTFSRRVVALVLGIGLLGFGNLPGQSLQSAGVVEGRMGYVRDTSLADGGYFIHLERLQLGGAGVLSESLNWNWKLTGGGIYQGESRYSNSSSFSPEYHFQSQLHPFKPISISLFSYYQVTDPVRIMVDSLVRTEWVNGVRFDAQLPAQTRFGIGLGYRTQQRDSVETARQFFQAQLEKRLFGLNFRVTAERDDWQIQRRADNPDFRQRAAISWHGRPFKGFSWTGSNSFYQQGETDYRWAFQEASYQRNRHELRGNYSYGDFQYGSRPLLNQKYTASYRYRLKPAFEVETIFRGSKVQEADSVTLFHWRSYQVGLNWQAGRDNFARGLIRTGFKESFNYGSGIATEFLAEEGWDILRSANFAWNVKDIFQGELFNVSDPVTEDFLYDVEHQIQTTLLVNPRKPFQYGDRLQIKNHIGVDLQFAEDTLRNAVTNELFVKLLRQRLQISVSYFDIWHLTAEDLEQRINTRATMPLNRFTTLNLMGLYRFNSDIYTDYLWLSAFVKVNFVKFDYVLDFQFRGTPEDFGQQNTLIWMRFMRRF